MPQTPKQTSTVTTSRNKNIKQPEDRNPRTIGSVDDNSPTNSPDYSLYISQYNTLRDEIVKHMEFRAQFININLAATGVLFTLGVQQSSAVILLIYTVLGLFLFDGWVLSNLTMYKISNFIKNKIENESPVNLPHPGWETYTLSTNNQWYVGFDVVAWGLFIGPQMIALWLAEKYPATTGAEETLFFVARLAISTSLIILLYNFFELRRLLRKRSSKQSLLWNYPIPFLENKEL